MLMTNNAKGNSTSSFSVTTNPTLVIGLGGSGGQVVARIKKLIEQSYTDKGVNVSHLINYLVLDSDKFENLQGVPQEYLDNSDGNEFFMLSSFNPRNAFLHYYNNESKSSEDLRKWFPKEEGVNILQDKFVDNGASRQRLTGRFFFYHNRSAVRDKLRSKIAQCLKGNPGINKDTSRLRVVIVSSSCGGTGSSAFLDLLYMIKLELMDRETYATIEAAIMLPQMFIDAASQKNAILRTYLKANAYAFFRELDFIMKNPNSFNELAMDSISQNRNEPYPKGKGLPADSLSPLDFIYLLGEGVTRGFGNFGSLRDLYDFTARSIFYTQFEASVFRSVQSKISNTESLMNGEQIHGRPTRYAALGFAEIRYPGELMLKYFEFVAEKHFIDCAFIGEKYPGRPDHVKERALSLRALIAENVEKPLNKMLTKEASKALDRLDEQSDYFDNSGKKVDFSNDFNLPFQSAERALKFGISGMDSLLNDVMDTYFNVFTATIDQETNSLSDSNGLSFLLDVLNDVNDKIEDDQVKIEGEIRNRIEPKIQRALLGITGGSESNPSETVSKITKKNKTAPADLREYFSNIHEWVTSSLNQHKKILVVELLSRLVGKKGNDPVPRVFNSATKSFEPGAQTERSILDKRTDSISRLIGVLAEKSSLLDPDAELRRYLDVVGKAPTTIYLPSFSLSEFTASSENFKNVRDTFGFSNEGNDPALQKLRQKFLRKITSLLSSPETDGGLGLLVTELLSFGLSDWYTDTQNIVKHFVNQSLKDHYSKDIIPLLEESGKKEELLDLLHKSSEIAAKISMNKYTNEQDKLKIQKLHFFGGPEMVKENDTFKPEKADFFTTKSDRLVETRITGIIPFWIFQGITSLENDYYNRDDFDSNLPHLDHRFNNGELDEIDPFGGAHGKNPLDVYLKMQALSLILSGDSNPFDTIKFDKEAIAMTELEPTFIYQVTSKLDRYYGVNAIAWNIDWSSGSPVLTPASNKPVMISDEKLTSSIRRAELVKRYRKENAVLSSHTALLEEFFETENNIRILRKGIMSMREIYLSALKRTRETEMFDIALNQRKTRRTPIQETLLLNEEFYTKCCRRLGKIVENYDSLIGDDGEDGPVVV